MLRLILLASILLPGVARAQLEPDPRTLTPKEKQRREALDLYVLGLLHERDNNLFMALFAYQDSARLDPEQAAVYRAQVPLLMSLDKGTEAVECCKKALDLEPKDFETWYVQGRLQKMLGQTKEARASLEKGLAVEAVRDRPEIIAQMNFELAGVLESLDEHLPAVAAFQNALKILEHPEALTDIGPNERHAMLQRSADVYERIGLSYRKAGKVSEAIAAFQTAEKRWPQSEVRTSFHLASLLKDENRPAEALAALERYLRYQPQSNEPYLMKMELLTKLKRGAEIVPWLKAATDADAHNKSLRMLLAKHYRDTQRNADAEQIYLGLAKSAPSPEIFEELFHLMRAYKPAANVEILDMFNGVTDRAKEQALAGQQARAMVAVIRNDRELSVDLLKLGLGRLDFQNDDLKFETVHFLAILADRSRKAEEAEKFYRAALTRAQIAHEAILYSGLLRMLWRQGKHQDIVNLCERGLAQAKGTKTILFHNEKAKALARLERYDDALAESDKAIEIAADNERLTVRHARVRILSQAERFDDAERECFGLLKEFNSPSDAVEIHYLLSNVYNHSKELKKSEDELVKVLRLDPNNATANNDLGYLWADQNKNLKEAEEMIRRAIDLDRAHRKSLPNLPEDEDYDNAAYVDSLGWVLFRNGQLQEARRELERASKLPDGDDPVMFDHLGDVYSKLNQPERARESYGKAVDLYEREKRRKMDDRYRELQRKIKLLAN